MSINESARNALSILLDEAERRDYNPPVNTTVVAELEWIIAQSRNSELSDRQDD